MENQMGGLIGSTSLVEFDIAQTLRAIRWEKKRVEYRLRFATDMEIDKTFMRFQRAKLRFLELQEEQFSKERMEICDDEF